MNGQEIYNVVGPFQKAPWWPMGLDYDPEAGCWFYGVMACPAQTVQTLFVGAAVEWLHENEQTFVPAIYKAPTLVESAMLECEAVAAKLIIVWKGSHATTNDENH